MIVLTAFNGSENDKLDARFGRCEYFAFYNPETEAYNFVENEAKRAGSGAGVSAVQYLSDRNVQTLITGEVGPKAKRALEAAGIETYVGAQGTVAQALQDYHNGELTKEI